MYNSMCRCDMPCNGRFRCTPIGMYSIKLVENRGRNSRLVKLSACAVCPHKEIWLNPTNEMYTHTARFSIRKLGLIYQAYTCLHLSKKRRKLMLALGVTTRTDSGLYCLRPANATCFVRSPSTFLNAAVSLLSACFLQGTMPHFCLPGHVHSGAHSNRLVMAQLAICLSVLFVRLFFLLVSAIFDFNLFL